MRKSMVIIGYGTMGREYARLFAKDFDVWAVSSRDVSEIAKRDGAKGTLDVGPAVASSKYVAMTVPLTGTPRVVQHPPLQLGTIDLWPFLLGTCAAASIRVV